MKEEKNFANTIDDPFQGKTWGVLLSPLLEQKVRNQPILTACRGYRSEDYPDGMM